MKYVAAFLLVRGRASTKRGSREGSRARVRRHRARWDRAGVSTRVGVRERVFHRARRSVDGVDGVARRARALARGCARAARLGLLDARAPERMNACVNARLTTTTIDSRRRRNSPERNLLPRPMSRPSSPVVRVVRARESSRARG